MNKSEWIEVLSIIDGPMQIDDKGYTLLCNIKTQDGKTSVDEIKNLSLNEATAIKSCVEIYGPQTIDAVWNDEVEA